MDNILIGSDNLWEVLGPVDVASAAGISAPSAITGRLFDDQADTSCSVDAASAQKDLDVAHPEHFANGDSASIVLDDGTVQVNVVVSSAGSTLTLTDNLTDTVAAGNQVAKKIGADVTISTTNFGVVTAVEGDPTWGYRGTIPNTQAGFTHGMRVRGEATFNGGAGLLVVLTQHATAFLPSLGEPPP